MTEEQIKAKAKEYFPNDEFKQQAVIDAINWATKELQEELEKWKAEWQEQVQKANDEGYARTLQTTQLNKAKKLLKKVVTDFHNMDCVTVHIDKTIAEAEQFLKENA